MHRFLSYLQNHKWLNITIAIIYYLIVVTTHKKVGRLVAQNLDKPLGRDNYNLLVLLVGSSVLLFSVAFFYKRFKNNLDIRDKQKLLFYLGLLLALIIVAVNVIMVVNVEIIHIAQYCVMAILVFPLLKNFNLTMLCTTILGVIDEAYQYWYLFPEKSDYFDFNDVIINFLGVILGLIIVRSQGFKSLTNNKVWYKSSFFYLVIFIIIISSLGLIFGIISTSPNLEESSALIELVRKHKPGFWRIIPPQVKFHVIRPLEFVFLIFILMGLFRKLGQ